MQERNLKFSTSIKGNRYLELKEKRQELAAYYIKQGKMADPERKYSLGSAPALVGECMDMCPLFERHEREFQTGGLDKSEKIPGTENVDHQRAVKRYRRSAAGDPPPLPCDVRPPHVLMKTLDYLLEEILGKNGLLDSYSFVRDRARAIRNDLTLQNYRGQEAVDLCEKIARYHILTSHELCDVEGISLQQEHEQMRKTLQSLMEFYREMNEKNIEMPNEAEFQAYYILTHAYSNETASKAETLPEKVFYDPQVQFALEIQSMMARTNEEYIQGRSSENGSLNLYSAIFKELEKPSTSYLMACCIHLSFIDIRRGALKAMQKAFYCFPDDNSSIWPIEELVILLGFDSELDAFETLDYYEIPYENGAALIGKQINGGPEQKMNKGNFTEGQRVSLAPRKSQRIVNAKRKGVPDVDIIQGRVKNTPFISKSFIRSHNTNNIQPSIHINPIIYPIKLVPSGIFSEESNVPPVFEPHPPKTVIPRDAIGDYTNALLNDCINEILYKDKFFHQILQTKLHIIDSICWEFVNHVVNQVIHEFVSERLSISHKVSLYLKTLESIIAEIVDEVIESEVGRVGSASINHMCDLREYEKRYQMLGWDRWKYYLMRNKKRILSKQKNAKEFLLNLKGFSSVTPKKHKGSLNHILPVNDPVFHDENAGRELLSPIDLPSLIAQSNSGISSWKLSFSIPSTPKIVQNFEQFLNYWLRSKLLSNLGDDSNYTSSTVNNKAYHVVTQSVKCSEIRHELQPNHRSLCSGVNAVIFVLDPYIRRRTFTKYWKTQSDRLFAFVSALPLQAKIPLLLIYWSNTPTLEISEEEIMSHLGLAYILKDGPLSSCQFLKLLAHSAFFDSRSLAGLIIDQVRILIKKSDDIESRLHFDIHKGLIESRVIDLFDDLVLKAQEKLNDMGLGRKSFFNYSADHNEFEAALNKSQARLFQHFIAFFNNLISTVQQIITEFGLQCIAYPAKEFCELDLAHGVGIGWNSDSFFSEIKGIFSKLQLHDASGVNQSSHIQLEVFYSNYAKLVKSGPAQISQNEVNRIIETYPLSEWLAKFVNLFTKNVLGVLFSKMKKINPPFFAKSFLERMHHHMYIMQKSTFTLLEEIIEELSSIQNLEYTSQFRKTRKRFKSIDSSPKAEDARKKMKDLVALAQKEIENVQNKLSQV